MSAELRADLELVRVNVEQDQNLSELMKQASLFHN